MINDFELFVSDDGDPAVDPDIALIAAFVARELTAVQIAAVQDRLSNDSAFRAKVEPLLEALALPGAWDNPHTRTAGSSAAIPPEELDAGWRRHLAATHVPPVSLRANAHRVSWSVKRIAAVIALAVLPMVTFAQVVRYAAAHPGSPGHSIARSIAAPLTERRSSPSPTRPPSAPLTINDARPGGPAWNMIPAETQPRPAHPLGTVLAKSSVTLGSAAQLVELSDGRLFVADPVQRLLQLFDPQLANPVVVLDSATGKSNTFDSGIATGGTAPAPRPGVAQQRISQPGPGGGAPALRAMGNRVNYLTSFRGDSALWYDLLAETFVVIDPAGKIGRTIAPPPLLSMTDHRPDPAIGWGGGLVYKIIPLGGIAFGNLQRNRPESDSVLKRARHPALQFVPWNGPDTTFSAELDSLMVVRTHFGSARVDTLDMLAIGGAYRVTRFSGQPQFMLEDLGAVYEPLRFADDVVTTSNGYAVVLHSREYRLDWYGPEGGRETQRLPYPWRRITPDIRRALVDTISKISQASTRSAVVGRRTADSVSLGRIRVNDRRAPLQAASGSTAPTDPNVTVLAGASFPDYFAPVPSRGALLADADGNVWIQQVLPGNPSHTEWEIVSRTQGSIDRVRIPFNRQIGGFGRGGIVYLIAYDAGVARLEKVRVK